jgi:hypothetical protein
MGPRRESSACLDQEAAGGFRIAGSHQVQMIHSHGRMLALGARRRNGGALFGA